MGRTTFGNQRKLGTAVFAKYSWILEWQKYRTIHVVPRQSLLGRLQLSLLLRK